MKQKPHVDSRTDTQLARCMVVAGLLGASLGMTVPAQAEPEAKPAPVRQPAKSDEKRPAAAPSTSSRQLKLTAPQVPDGSSRQVKGETQDKPQALPAIDSSSRQYKVEYTPLPGTPELAPPADQKPVPPR